MRKILIFAYNMHIGGIQKSLLNLITFLSNRYDITLFLFSNKGEYLSQIPKNVTLVFPKKKYFAIGMSQKELLHYSFFTFLIRLFLKILICLFGREKILEKYLNRCIPKEKYDVCISFQQNGPGNSMLFGANYCCLNAFSKTKISFVHSDFEISGTATKSNIEEYSKFDYIFSVSQTGKNTLCKYFEEAKLRTCKNVHLINNINVLSKKMNIKKMNICSFVTVSRISEEKGIDRILKAALRLNELGFKYIWRIIGDGPLLNKYNSIKNKYNIKNIIFEGAKDNPYPYIAASDYLVITSRHEASPMVVQEAQILKKSVLAVNYSSAEEFLSKTNICNNDDDALLNLLKSAIIKYPAIMQSFDSEYTDGSNEDNIKELIEVLN